MTRKLTQPDRQAVDLVMDRMPRGNDGIIVVGAAPSEPRVQAVEKILGALAEMPADEPAGDLVQRTLRRIDGSATVTPGAQRPAAPFIPPGQWHA